MELVSVSLSIMRQWLNELSIMRRKLNVSPFTVAQYANDRVATVRTYFNASQTAASLARLPKGWAEIYLRFCQQECTGKRVTVVLG